MIVFNFIFNVFLTGVVLFCYVVTVSFIVWMSVDAAKQDRFWWLSCIIGIPVIGAAVYYLTEKKHQYRKIESHYIHESETETQHENAPKKKRVRKVKEESVISEVNKVLAQEEL